MCAAAAVVWRAAITLENSSELSNYCLMDIYVPHRLLETAGLLTQLILILGAV